MLVTNEHCIARFPVLYTTKCKVKENKILIQYTSDADTQKIMGILWLISDSCAHAQLWSYNTEMNTRLSRVLKSRRGRFFPNSFRQ